MRAQVVALHYRLITAQNLSFQAPEPVEDETEWFTVRLAEDMVTFQMKWPYASEVEAKDKAQPYLHAWEVSAGLEFGPQRTLVSV